MKLKVVHCMAGSDYVHNPGDVVEFADDEAVRLIDAGIAEPLAPETAQEGPAETAAQPRGRKRVAGTGNGADS
jgi:hypothetical protein